MAALAVFLSKDRPITFVTDYTYTPARCHLDRMANNGGGAVRRSCLDCPIPQQCSPVFVFCASSYAWPCAQCGLQFIFPMSCGASRIDPDWIQCNNKSSQRQFPDPTTLLATLALSLADGKVVGQQYPSVVTMNLGLLDRLISITWVWRSNSIHSCMLRWLGPCCIACGPVYTGGGQPSIDDATKSCTLFCELDVVCRGPDLRGKLHFCTFRSNLNELISYTSSYVYSAVMT